jgi:hypothetical protein
MQATFSMRSEGRGFPMRHRSGLVTLPLLPSLALLSACLSTVQIAEDIPPPAVTPLQSTPERVPAQVQTGAPWFSACLSKRLKTQ